MPKACQVTSSPSTGSRLDTPHNRTSIPHDRQVRTGSHRLVLAKFPSRLVECQLQLKVLCCWLSPSPFLTSLSPLRAGAIVSSSPTTVLPLSLPHNLESYTETGLGHDDLTLFSDNIIDNNSVSIVDHSRHFLRVSLPPSKYQE